MRRAWYLILAEHDWGKLVISQDGGPDATICARGLVWGSWLICYGFRILTMREWLCWERSMSWMYGSKKCWQNKRVWHEMVDAWFWNKWQRARVFKCEESTHECEICNCNVGARVRLMVSGSCLPVRGFKGMK